MRGCIDVVFERNDCCHFSTKVFNGKGKVTSAAGAPGSMLLKRSEEHTSELQSQSNLVCRLLLEKKNMFGLNVHNVVVSASSAEPRLAIGPGDSDDDCGTLISLPPDSISCNNAIPLISISPDRIT